jgi:hypothetical protein
MTTSSTAAVTSRCADVRNTPLNDMHQLRLVGRAGDGNQTLREKLTWPPGKFAPAAAIEKGLRCSEVQRLRADLLRLRLNQRWQYGLNTFAEWQSKLRYQPLEAPEQTPVQ